MKAFRLFPTKEPCSSLRLCASALKHVFGLFLSLYDRGHYWFGNEKGGLTLRLPKFEEVKLTTERPVFDGRILRSFHFSHSPAPKFAQMQILIQHFCKFANSISGLHLAKNLFAGHKILKSLVIFKINQQTVFWYMACSISTP